MLLLLEYFYHSNRKSSKVQMQMSGAHGAITLVLCIMGTSTVALDFLVLHTQFFLLKLWRFNLCSCPETRQQV